MPEETLLQIVEAEDERHWDESDFGKLFADASPSVRRRAALAAQWLSEATWADGWSVHEGVVVDDGEGIARAG